MSDRYSSVVITGSGKCGSSLVAHSFFHAGFSMGTEEELVIHRGAKGNIGGYWEHAAILSMNEDILSFNGASWDNAPQLPLALSPELHSRMGLLTRGVA